MAQPVLVMPIPPQIVNELASFGPLDLKNFIQAPEGEQALRFKAELSTGQAMPAGMICTGDGIVTGIPAKDTQGAHEVIVTVENEAGAMQATFSLTIKPSMVAAEVNHLDKLKAQVWDALQNQLPLPELGDLSNLPITTLDVYYLLECWGTLTIWDAFNLDPPGEKHALTLEGVSEHYHVFDRGSSLIMCPKDLFSHERTIEDGMRTARALAREIYKREWTIEMAGLDKWTRAAWVELQFLGDKHGKRLEIINYTPSSEELRIYHAGAHTLGGGPE